MNWERIHLRISEISARHPGRPAIVYGGGTITYRQLEERSNSIANYLHRQVGDAGRVSIILDRSPGLIETILGILKSGSVFVPIDPKHPANRVKQLIKKARTPWLITNSQYYRDMEPLARTEGAKALLTEEISTGEDRLQFEAADNKYCYIYFTSGSTGEPKGVLGRHRSLAHFIRWELKEFGIDENFNISQLTNPAFDPYLRDIFAPLAAGGACCIPEEDVLTDPGKLKEWIRRESIHLMHIVPSLFKLLSKEIDETDSFPDLEYVLLAGELLRGGDTGKFMELFGDSIRLVNIYGPTETTLAKMFYRLKKEDASRAIIPVGRPISNSQAMVLDENMRKCPDGNIGEIYIRTPFISSGYFEEPGETKKVFLPNPFTGKAQDIIYKTGDLGRVLPDGNIELVGRLDHQVKIRGVRVEPAEIENRLIKRAGVDECVVLAREDGSGERYLCAYLTPTPGSSLKSTELREYLAGELPRHMIPAFFVFLEKMPLTHSGKINRRELPEPEIKTGECHAAPRDELERGLVNIWADILGIDPGIIGIDTNFFEIGGHSLRATHLAALVHKRYDVRLPLANVFKNQTVRAQAALINQLAQNRFLAIEPQEEKEYYPLSSAQKRLYATCMMNAGTTAYNISTAVLLEGELNTRLFHDAFQRTVKRHESLRTSFITVADIPVQRVHRQVNFKEEYHIITGEGEEREREITQAFIRPFHLGQAPLLRTGLLRKNQRQHILIVDIHHIISDAFSNSILVRDFMDLYDGKELAPLKLQYKDFSAWRHSRAGREEFQRLESYWVNRFKEPVPGLDIPSDYLEEPGRYSDEGAVYRFRVEEELTTKIYRLAADTGASLYMILLAVLNIFLLKYTGREDIVVGSPIAGRNHTDLKPIIGFFVNVLAMRNRPANGKTFAQLLEEVKQTALEAYENQDYPLDELVRKLGLQGSVDRNPLFRVVLAVLNMEIPVLKIQGLTLKPYGYEKQTSKFDLRFAAVETGARDRIAMTVTYSTALFKKETAAKMAERFLQILRQVLDDRDIKLQDIEISHGLTVTRSSAINDYQEEFDF
jgi:amino acid adenylation domain-containing protein